jgi:hypothetical protein
MDFLSTAAKVIVLETIFLIFYVFVLRKWFSSWGATREERAMHMPEDDMVKNPFIDMTHAITIQAPPESVFPWFRQIGQGRGGFYSYDRLERLFGFGIHNVYLIDPNLQDIRVGDHIRLHQNGMGVTVLALEDNKKLVIGMDSRNLPEGRKHFVPVAKGMFIAGFWSFTLIRQPDGSTRLIERWKIEWSAGNPILNMLLVFGFELPSFIMEQRMLRVIRMLSEGASSDQLGIL